jgi:GP23-major capsid protein
MATLQEKALLEKWGDVLNEGVAIADETRRITTAVLLENQQRDNAQQMQLNEAATTTTANIANYDPVLVSMVRRFAPRLIAYDICGVQAMQMPTGLVFAMRARYTDKNGAEALYNKVDTGHGGAGTQKDDASPFLEGSYTGSPSADVVTGTGMDTATGETAAWKSMSATIEKVQVTAKTRQLRADYSLEIAQDWKNVHGMDAEVELANILATELMLEQNQEVVRSIYQIAKPGAQFATTKGTFNITTDSDGRWSAERFKGLLYAIERDANAIALETRRGKGNILITSANVASALQIAGLLDFAPAIQAMNQNLEVDVTGTTYCGNMGRYRVYIDPMLAHDGYVVGYKGAEVVDAGLFYCPYVPLQIARVSDTVTFAPAIGFKTRYGLVENPFTTTNAQVLGKNSNIYYRKAAVVGL